MRLKDLTSATRLADRVSPWTWGAAMAAIVVAACAVAVDQRLVSRHNATLHKQASRHLEAVVHHADTSLARLKALGEWLSENPRFTSFLSGELSGPDVSETAARFRLMQRADVLAMSQALDAVAQDFVVQEAALLDVTGRVVANSAYRDPGAGLLGQHMADRPFFQQALRQGSYLGYDAPVAARPPAIRIAVRMSVEGVPRGVLVLGLDPTVMAKLPADAMDAVVWLTDQSGNTIASSRGALVRPLASDTPLRVTQSAQSVEVDGRAHVALSRPLPRHSFAAWIAYVPQGHGAIHAFTAALAIAALLATWATLVWLARRKEQTHIANLARQKALETTHWLPLSVYQFQIPPGQPGHFTHVGPGVEALLGRSPLSLQDGFRPSTQPTDMRLDGEDGTRWVRTQARRSVREDGTEVYDGYWQDVTQERRTERRLEALFMQAPVGVYICHRAEGILHCNTGGLALFGAQSLEDIKGRFPWAAPLSPVHQTGNRASATQARQLLDQQQSFAGSMHFEWRHLRLDGQPFEGSVTLVSLEHEGAGTFLAFIEDVSARKQVERAQQSAQEAASVNARAKTAFLSNMSHEIRTPMNAVIGMTHLALTDPHPDKLRAYVAKAHQAAKSLLQIINDILDLSRIEAGQLELECIEFPVQGVIDQLADVLGLQAEDKGLELLFSAPPDLPANLVGDPTRLRQILLNLASNAIKFTEHGSVTLGLEVQSRRGYQVVLHGWVRDTGIGIDAEQQSQLFAPFKQLDASTTRRFGGSGLGLSICRQLVERMGGKLWVESALGQGATFHFTAKTDLPSGPGQPVLLHDWTGKRALLADDNADAREVLSKMLESLGVNVDSVSTGEAALAAIDSADRPYDWILLDWKMPRMDGVACAHEIDRRSQARATHPCILLVTAFNREDALDAAQGVPLADVLTKPVTPATLFESLKRSYSVRALVSHAATADESMVAPDLLAGTRILLVEDQPLNQELARDLMELAGATVVCADNGAQALTALAREGPFDCVLMDCQMPVMDGYTATLKIRGQPQWAQLPIIAMTASALTADRQHALESGMNDHIAKPLDVHQTYQVVSKWVAESRASRQRYADQDAAQNGAAQDSLSG